VTAQTVAQLGQRTQAATANAQAQALETWRRWANGADIVGARNALPQAIDAYEAALTAKRVADNEVRAVKEQADDALADADWELDGCFETSGNKTSLFRDVNGDQIQPSRPMTADQRAAWKRTAARKLPAVADTAAALRKAENDAAAAADTVRVAEARLSAAKYTLNAAVAMLTTQAAAHPREI
jgi:hypothetical protein